MISFSKVLDLFLPPRCISCQTIVMDHKTLCVSCWPKASFISAPYCSCCGLPFEYETKGETLCLDCIRHEPTFKSARAVFPYDDFSRDLVLAFKHGDRTDLSPVFADWMVQAAQDMIEKCDVVVPVPLHWRRLVKRRFNQSALLAKEISIRSQLNYHPNILKRVRNTRPQGHLSRMARHKNLQGVFEASSDVSGKSVLLIDDVLTSGATVLYCTNALLKSGARDVHVLTLARVFQPKSH